MKSVKKILCVLLTLTMVVSCVTVGSIQSSAVLDESAVGESQSGLAQDTVQGSAILHCFCWSYDTIKSKLPEIAAAGYTAIQTSPVQPPKDYDASYTSTKDNWWKLYQPLDLAMTDGETHKAKNNTDVTYNSWLGTKSQFKDMCTEAESYGIKVIVDIVSNHIAASGGQTGGIQNNGTPYYPTYVNENAESFFQNSEVYYPNIGSNSDSSRYQQTHGHLGMPELNTSRSDVQQKVLSLMKECVDCGADGFRFDTAKHIELPDDPDYTSNGNTYVTKSDFWPTIINGINEYKDGLYIYGEILGDACSKEINKKYVEYMDLTDDNSCYIVRHGVKDNDAGRLSSSYYQKEINADQAVLWAESHDTFMNNDGDTKNDSVDTIVKTWAMVNSRASATSLFFVRPGERNGNEWTGTMGEAGTDTWQSKPVVESNKFKNLFADKSEYLSYNSSYNAAYNERGTTGVVITKADGAGYVKLKVNKISNGVYTDHVTGNKFTVANGYIIGTVGDSGVAVIYNYDDSNNSAIKAKTLYLNPARESWKKDDPRFAFYVFNNSTGTNAWISMTDPDGDGIYEGNVPDGAWEGVIFCRMNGTTTENNWGNKWNQTVDLVPEGYQDTFMISIATSGHTDSNGNYYGTWSTKNTHTHSYGSPSWEWNTQHTSATAAFACETCGESEIKTASISNSGSLYTASVEFNGKTYSDTDLCEKKLYFKPSSNWLNDSARFAAYVFNSSTTNAWIGLTDSNNDGIFDGTVPDGDWTGLIFCRMNGATTENNWNNKWNQTADLTFRLGYIASTPEHEWEKSQNVNWINLCQSQPVWNWTGYTSATAEFTLVTGQKQMLNAQIDTLDDDDKTNHIARVSFNGIEYTDSNPEYKRPTFEGNNAVLTDNIGLNFYVDCHQFGKDSVGSLTFRQQKNSGRTETTELTAAPDSTDTMYRAMFTVAAKEMGDEITASMTYNGQTFTSKNSVADYLKGLYNVNKEATVGTKEEALKTLARSMLNYGAKAQLQFNYKANEYELVDYGLDSYTPETTNGVKFEGEKIIGNTDLTYAGSSMLLEDTITYRVFFTAADKTNLPVVQYNNERLQKAKRADTSTTILRALRLRNF